MTDNVTSSEFEILNQFIKDLSFEAPNSPRIFFESNETTPKVETQFAIKTANSGENLYEVNLHMTVKNMLEKEVLFFIELSYSAMVAITPEIEQDSISEILIKKVGPYLYPFVREIVANITKDSGFSPFVMGLVDFDKVKIINNENGETTDN